MSREPVFVGTRVPLKTFLDYLAAGDSLEKFPDAFPSVTREQATTALEFAGDALNELAHRPVLAQFEARFDLEQQRDLLGARLAKEVRILKRAS